MKGPRAAFAAVSLALLLLAYSPSEAQIVDIGSNAAAYTGHGPGALRGVNVGPKINPDDVQNLAAWHVNLVRWQLTLEGWPDQPQSIEDFKTYDNWLESSLGHLDQMLPYFQKAHILVLVDLHSPPGGKDSSRVQRVFTDQACEAHFLQCWHDIAVKYRNERQIWGYDLLNEPGTPPAGQGIIGWHELAERAAENIRSLDPAHAIIVEPDPYGIPKSFKKFQPLHVPGVVYSVHMYDPAPFTFQGVIKSDPIGPEYPGIIAGKMWDIEHLRAELQPVANFAKANHAHIYVGEFSVIRWANGGDRYLSDLVEIMEENQWDWTYHAFHEWSGWSLQVSDDPASRSTPPEPTDRLLVMLSAFSKNRPETISAP